LSQKSLKILVIGKSNFSVCAIIYESFKLFKGSRIEVEQVKDVFDGIRAVEQAKKDGDEFDCVFIDTQTFMADTYFFSVNVKEKGLFDSSKESDAVAFSCVSFLREKFPKQLKKIKREQKQ